VALHGKNVVDDRVQLPPREPVTNRHLGRELGEDWTAQTRSEQVPTLLLR
jgi:hypothetical protein